jgi:arylsulfatase A-like enzyme
MCYLFDVLPTIGALWGVTGPHERGDRPHADAPHPATTARPKMMFAFRDIQRALRDERWKLIRYPQVERTQLFDLKNDPHETTNLAARPEHANACPR